MSVADILIVAVVVLYLGLLAVWANQRRLDLERDRDAVRLAVLEGRTDLLTKAARELRDRDQEKTQRMTEAELRRVKQGKSPTPDGH